jgi:hypothetical protein
MVTSTSAPMRDESILADSGNVYGWDTPFAIIANHRPAGTRLRPNAPAAAWQT